MQTEIKLPGVAELAVRGEGVGDISDGESSICEEIAFGGASVSLCSKR
jgi:hypothetical protein